MPELSPHVFISYARVNRDFARDLYERLEALDFSLWRDLHNMEPGKDWWQQIQEAIESSETMVLCLSVEALLSRVVGDEWRYARQVGTRVIPVVADEVFNHPDVLSGKVVIPHWMKKADWLDFRANTLDVDLAWKRLINTLNTEHIPQRVPFSVPPDLYDRQRFVDRPAEYEPLKIALLIDDSQDPVAIATALHGGGGFGKTTLAAALCYDDDILTAFDDGILWLTLGQKPDVAALMSSMYRTLTNEEMGFRSANEGGPVLAERLKGKDCLIVLDDVWQYSHVKPFLNLGERCACLITTRRFQVAVEADAIQVNVDEMQTGEAVQMLTAGLELQPEDRDAFHRLAVRLGEWPLLLEIANGMLRRRYARTKNVGQALDWVNKALEKRGVTGIVRENEEERKQGAAGTLAVSTDLLEPEERERYRSLAIFPEDVTVPLTALAALWELDDFDTEQQVEDLADLSLLRWDVQANTIRLHDVLRQYLAEQMGENSPTYHACLLDAWGDRWTDLPDDYAWNYYTYHLHGAELDEELLSLFADQRWLEARFEHDGYTYTGYVADLMLTWTTVAQKQALVQLEGGREMTALADCLRLALIRTSINSLAGNYDPVIVARAVASGIWSAERGLSIARRVPDGRQQVEMYCALLNTQLTEPQRRQAQEQALATAQAIQDEGNRSRVLSILANKLDGDLVGQALSAAQAIQSDWSRARVLSALATRLEEDLVDETFAAALDIQDERSRSEVLSFLADKLEGDLVNKALVAAQAIENEQSRSYVLRALAAKLDGNLVGKALAAAQAIQHEWSRAHVLRALATKLEGDHLEAALATAKAIQNEQTRAYVLKALEGEAVAAPQAVRNELSRSDIPGGWLELDRVSDALAAAQAIQDEWARAHVLSTLADRLAGKQREQVLGDALSATQAISNEDNRAHVLSALAAKLEGPLVSEALAVAQAIHDERSRSEVLSALAAKLEGDLVGEALAAAQAIQHEKSRAHILSALADKLKGDLIGEVLVVAQSIKDEWSRAHVLSALADKLEGDLVGEALAAAQAIQDEGYRARVLRALAANLQRDLVGEAVAAAQTIQDEWSRAYVLSALGIEIEEDWLNETLVEAQTLQDEQSYSNALDDLTASLEGDLLDEALAAAETIQEDWSRSGVLIALANKLEGNLRMRIFLVNLLNFEHVERSFVLTFCANPAWYDPAYVPQDIVYTITRHVVEICNDWLWL